MPKLVSQSHAEPASATNPFLPTLSPRFTTLGWITLLVVTTCMAYLPAMRGEFILDDDIYVTNNRLITAPDGWYRFWLTTEPIDYYPMSNSTLWIEWRLWGLHPTGYHVTNLLLHIAAALLVWTVLRKLSIPGAYLAALLFAVHPVNIESVAWISQRKGLLAMLFFLLSILWYLKVVPQPPDSDESPVVGQSNRLCHPSWGRWYWLSLLAFLLAMLSKGSVATLPLVLLLIVWWQRRQITMWDLTGIAPFFLAAVLLSGVNIWFQSRHVDDVIRSVSFGERLLGAGAVVWFYLSKAILPINLVFIYRQWHIEVDNLRGWLPLLAALGVTVVLWSQRGNWRGRPLLFAWGFFGVALVPVLGFIDVGFMKHSLVADHYQHIALVGVMALAAAAWSNWYQRTREASRPALVVIAAVIVGTFTLLTWQHSRLYADAITLYQATLEKNPASWLTHYNLAAELAETGWSQEVIKNYEQALRFKPNYANAHSNLGVALLHAGRLQEAIEHFEQALQLKPSLGETHNNLGTALEQVGRYEEAIEQYRQALQLRPDYPEAQNNMGLVLLAERRAQEAMEYLDQALQLKPDYAEAHLNLGNVLLALGRKQEAEKHFEQALQFKPTYAEAHYNLGNMLVGAGRAEEAIDHYQQALQIKPNYAEAHSNLGAALAQAGRTPEAIQQFREALKLKPDLPEVHDNLGVALAKTGQLQEGIEHFQQAIRLKTSYADAYVNLATAYVQMHRSAEAIAAAQTALELAHAQGKKVLEQRIEAWLTKYRSQQSNPQDASSQSDTIHPSQ